MNRNSINSGKEVIDLTKIEEEVSPKKGETKTKPSFAVGESYGLAGTQGKTHNVTPVNRNVVYLTKTEEEVSPEKGDVAGTQGKTSTVTPVVSRSSSGPEEKAGPPISLQWEPDVEAIPDTCLKMAGKKKLLSSNTAGDPNAKNGMTVANNSGGISAAVADNVVNVTQPDVESSDEEDDDAYPGGFDDSSIDSETGKHVPRVKLEVGDFVTYRDYPFLNEFTNKIHGIDSTKHKKCLNTAYPIVYKDTWVRKVGDTKSRQVRDFILVDGGTMDPRATNALPRTPFTDAAIPKYMPARKKFKEAVENYDFSQNQNGKKKEE